MSGICHGRRTWHALRQNKTAAEKEKPSRRTWHALGQNKMAAVKEKPKA